MLTEILKIFSDIRSEHEPAPNYSDILPSVKENPRASIEFLKEKINIINNLKEQHYAETSNVFGKGFLIPLVRMGISPQLIFLNRNFRKTAKSLYTRGSFPMRTTLGKQFSADPTAPGSLPIFEPQTLSNYQLCYWGVLDSYYRQIQAERIYQKISGNFLWASTDDFKDFNKTLKVGSLLGLHVDDLEEARRMHKKITTIHHNPNVPSPANRWQTSIDHDKEETEVIDRVAFYDLLFIENVRNSQFIDASLAKNLH
ncbi:hypothetical protein [Salinicola rhizosphaerae]|uniref:Uncharacterized protein n=1 Tax=Salinicola rhizosphaerae TaxID=1443141 RepID=A0ABQ3DRT1_9GAMM|nr:hypothetical protein [Salinicola rhizosphaerae]GHB10082.1 hypothetical protein GCM10009038_04780 [Salinicola rhizosphaerae]